MKINSIDNFISGLEDFYFHSFKDFFPDVSKKEFDKIFNEAIDLRKEEYNAKKL